MLKGVYTPKYHQDRLYYNIFKNHWSGFLSIYEQRFLYQYGPLEDYQQRTVEKFIKCGDPKHGFAYYEICFLRKKTAILGIIDPNKSQ